MKTLSVLLLSSILGLSFFSIGCEVSHTESDKPGLFGGNKHEETTVTKNPVTGNESVEHSEQKTNP